MRRDVESHICVTGHRLIRLSLALKHESVSHRMSQQCGDHFQRKISPTLLAARESTTETIGVDPAQQTDYRKMTDGTVIAHFGGAIVCLFQSYFGSSSGRTSST